MSDTLEPLVIIGDNEEAPDPVPKTVFPSLDVDDSEDLRANLPKQNQITGL